MFKRGRCFLLSVLNGERAVCSLPKSPILVGMVCQRYEPLCQLLNQLTIIYVVSTTIRKVFVYLFLIAK